MKIKFWKKEKEDKLLFFIRGQIIIENTFLSEVISRRPAYEWLCG